MKDELAIVETSPGRLSEVIRTAALYGSSADPHEEMYVRVDSDAIETPAGASEATQTSYPTFRSERFERLSASEEVAALFPVAEVLGWLEWLDSESSLRLSFVGESGASVVSEIILTGDDRTVSVSCIDDPTVLEGVETWLPERFDDGTFLDADGRPVPTRIETTARTLRTVVEAIDQATGGERYPLTTSTRGLTFEASGERASVSGELTASVHGPAVDNRYGPGFKRVVNGLEGSLDLQTGPGEDLVVVSDQPGTRLRYYVQVRTPHE